MAKNLTVPQREDLRNRISELYLRGYGIGRIAAEVCRVTDYSVSGATVSAHLKVVQKGWFEKREKDIAQRINTELMKINEVEYEAWQAWKRSCKSKTKKTTKRRGTPAKNKEGVAVINPQSVSEIEQTEEMVGDSRFLDIIAKCIDTRLQWITKGMDEKPKNPAGVTNITNNTVLVMSNQERYVPEKLKQMDALVVPNVGKT